ncbi:four helix bundle protein [Arachidicoccus ginsenosidimutans]|uniref:four helix bundle protein n=1 Tax=Arachidicoccus sp. BS20 TaxID=1850526 RepID=UPI00210143DE|nr:four helix bundle protein [Arachidicoccus sp. BS20]
MMRNDKENVIVEKTINFSLSIIKYCEVLEQDRKYVIAKQLLRSATSIGANVLKRKMQKVKMTSFIR